MPLLIHINRLVLPCSLHYYASLIELGEVGVASGRQCFGNSNQPTTERDIMRRNIFLRPLGLFLLMAGMLVAGCSDDGDDVKVPTTDPSACATINYSEENATVTCQLTKPGESTTVNSVDLNEIIDQLAQFQVTKNTVVWFQLWGANGGEGSNSDGGQAGKIGYSQMITSVADFESRGEEGSVIYFYLGQHGTHNTNSGGQGGASSFVTTEDMSQNPGSDPDTAQILMIAGGGGGGGGSNTANFCEGGTKGKNGGDGGLAFSSTTSVGSGPGGDGGSDPNTDNGGKGGDAGSGGTGHSHNGHDGFGGRGGDGGKSGLGTTSWINTGATPLTFSAGEGAAGDDLQNTSCVSGGGGGGGGWGGGGGGGYAQNLIGGPQFPYAGGGGGGASYSIKSSQTDGRAPQQEGGVPANPNGATGFIQLVFDFAPDP